MDFLPPPPVPALSSVTPLPPASLMPALSLLGLQGDRWEAGEESRSVGQRAEYLGGGVVWGVGKAQEVPHR